MSLKRDVTYPARFDAATSGQPQGAFKNRSAPGASDGSYLEEAWLNDWSAFFSSLLADGGLTANGNVDAVGASQYRDALLNVILKRKSFGLSDFVRIPDVPGGLIVQWGSVVGNSSGVASITFPAGFPTAVMALTANVLANNFSTYSVNIVGLANSTCTLNATNNNVGVLGASIRWIAIGY